MEFNRFRLSIIIRLLFLSITFILLSYFVLQKEFVMLSIILSVLITIQTYSLIKYTELMNRDLKRFLDSIEFSDFSQSFRRTSNLYEIYFWSKNFYKLVITIFMGLLEETISVFQVILAIINCIVLS